jgi:hypothetical protein
MEEQDAPRGDYSISELRSMMTGEQPADKTSEADGAEDHTAEGTDAGDGEGTDQNRSNSEASDADADGKKDEGRPRGEDGKFKAKEGDNVQKRIDKAIKAQREAERERDELRAQLAKPGSQPAKETAQPAAEKNERPDPAKFETYDQYIEALQDWKYDERKRKDAAEAQAETQRRAEAQTLGEHNARVGKARETHSDYDDVLATVATLQISRELHQAIVSSEYGPEVAYRLAKDPDEAKRIAALPPLRQVAEFGRLEALVNKPAAKTADKKPLPKPAAKVGGGASAKSLALDDPDISMSTFKRLATAALRK